MVFRCVIQCIYQKSLTISLDRFNKKAYCNAIQSQPIDFDIPASKPRRENGYWDSVDKRRSFIDNMAQSLGVKEFQDWTNISTRQFIQAGGGAFLNLYQGSLSKALKDLFPENKLDSIIMRQRNYWTKIENQRSFLEQVAPSLGVQNVGDWV